MQKNILSFVFLFILSCSASFAEPLPRRAFEIGPEIYHFTYEEKGLGVKDTGVFYGAKASWTYHNRYMFRLEGRGAIGEVDYTSDGTGSANNISDYNLEGRILVGYDFIDEEARLYTIYSGFGYRFLSDQGGGSVTSTGALGYDRESNYYYLPLGIEGTAAFDYDWNVGGYLEVDFLLAGTQETKLSTASPIFNDISNDQGEGYGFRGGLKIKKIYSRYDVVIEPFFRIWSIRNSDTAAITRNGVVTDIGQEPRNTTHEFGANVSLAF